MLKQQVEKDAPTVPHLFSFHPHTSAKHVLCKAQGPLDRRWMRHPNMLYVQGMTNAIHDFNRYIYIYMYVYMNIKYIYTYM